MLDHPLERAEAGPSADEEHGAVGCLAQGEGPQGRLDAQDGLLRQAMEDMIGEGPARDMADMQFDERIVVGGVGDGEGPLAPVREYEVQILAGEELQALALRQLEPEAHDIVVELFLALHPTRQEPRLDLTGAAHLFHSQRQVSQGHRLTGETGPLRTSRQGLDLGAGIGDLAGHQGRGTGPALAVAATVGEPDALAQGGREEGLTRLGGKAPVAGLGADGETHGNPRNLCGML